MFSFKINIILMETTAAVYDNRLLSMILLLHHKK